MKKVEVIGLAALVIFMLLMFVEYTYFCDKIIEIERSRDQKKPEPTAEEKK